MELLKIISEPTGLELFIVIMGVIGLIATFLFTVCLDCKSNKLIALNVVAYVVTLCIIYFGASMTNNIVYYYSVDDATKVQEMLDNGYNLESTDAERYSFTKVE